MSEMLNTATTAVQLVVTRIGGSGPKMTNVGFTQDASGAWQWAWVPNALATQLRPGMVLAVEQVSPASKPETSYTNAVGVVVELKEPKRQLFLGGEMVVGAPEQEPLKPVTFVVTDEARKFANNYDAKRDVVVADLGSDEPF